MIKAYVLTVSDRCAEGLMEDRSGPVLCGFLAGHGIEVVASAVVPDDADRIRSEILKGASSADLVLTTGGTGISPRDVTPEATRPLLDKELPGISEAIRMESLRKTKNAMLSRGIAGVIGTAIVVNLPGSPKGAVESAEVFIDCIEHASAIARGEKADG